MSSSGDPASWITGEPPLDEEGNAVDDGPWIPPFSGDINEWLAVGGDFRAAYIYIRPDRGAAPGEERNVTSTFFQMQGDLYHSARLHEHLTLVLDIGLYSGFEAWGLFRYALEPADFDFTVRVGRFMPPFGMREVEHQLFTREGIGLGGTDRDTGIEVTTYLGPVTITAALLN